MRDYQLPLDEAVKNYYDGYLFGEQSIYNPWSILNYPKMKKSQKYWVNTSTNKLIRESLDKVEFSFFRSFERLIVQDEVEVGINLEAAFIELEDSFTLWGLLVNAGYLTIVEELDVETAIVKVPNDEVRAEFRSLVAHYTKLPNTQLNAMLSALTRHNVDSFLDYYQDLVLSYTGYYDVKENGYHMLLLSMLASLGGLYKISNNIESGHG